MEIKEVGIGARLGLRGLRQRGMVEICDDPATGEFTLFIGRGIRQRWYRRWLKVNLPEKMWQVKCSREELAGAIDRLLTENLLTKE